MQDEELTIHPAVAGALAMTAIVMGAVALVMWPMFLSHQRAGVVSDPPRRLDTSHISEERFLTAAPPIEAADRRIEQGVKLAFESADSAARDARHARLIALYVPQGEPPTPFLPAGPFVATWSGDLNVDLRDRFIFTFEGTGELELTINGQSILTAGERESPRVRLSTGPNPFTARYRSPPRGPAQVRLLWQGSEFPREPIPPTVLTHDAADVEVRTGERLRRGRDLLATGRCLRCHTPPGPVAQDLVRDAPALVTAGHLDHRWLMRWIADPHSVRADARMPRMVANSQDAADVAAFIARTFSVDAEARALPNDPQATRLGAQLYLDLGCTACHGGTGPNGEGSGAVIPLHASPDSLRKYSPTGLADYLTAPQRLYAWSRMPHFDLSQHEADRLAAYLLSTEATSQGPAFESQRHGDAARGRQLVESLGCANCHAGLPVGSSLKAPSYAQVRRSDWSRGCVALDENQRGAGPDFGYSAEEREALLAFVRRDAGVGRFVPAEFAQRQIEELRCTACHRYDGRVDDWTLLAPQPVETRKTESAEAELDQTRPMLTFAGEKLNVEYLEAILAGRLEHKPRPWMEARMPSFGIRAKGLAQGLAMMHGFPPADAPIESPDPQLAAIGQKLIDKRWGFGCTDCHGIGDQPPLNTFEAIGINFADIAARLRGDWTLRWMLDPMRIEPATKMPRYVDEHGATQITDILDGRGVEQFQAIWHYLQTIH
jgi:mono/diheme cytochrome c family protein